MTLIRIFYRSILLCIVILVGCLLTVIFQNGSISRDSLSSKITCWWHRRMANTLGIPVRVYGKPSERATLFVANHISWFDISAIGGILPVRFLSKIEVKHMPVVGWLASRAGTLYIPRGGKAAAETANNVMADALLQQQHVVLFPEGTTGDGTIKRFHSRLIQSAINAGSVVQPVAIRYPYKNENDIHPSALFVGDITMGQSLCNVLGASDLVAEVHFLEAVEIHDKNRDQLAAHAEEKIRLVIENE